MKMLNPETIKDSIYESVLKEVSETMAGILAGMSGTDKPLTENQLAEFVVSVISETIDKTVDATIEHLITDSDIVAPTGGSAGVIQ